MHQETFSTYKKKKNQVRVIKEPTPPLHLPHTPINTRSIILSRAFLKPPFQACRYSISVSTWRNTTTMSSSALRTGVTFALGAMFGSFLTQGMYHRRHHNSERVKRGPWSRCPLQSRAPEPSAPVNPGTEEGITAATPMVIDSQAV